MLCQRLKGNDTICWLALLFQAVYGRRNEFAAQFQLSSSNWQHWSKSFDSMETVGVCLQIECWTNVLEMSRNFYGEALKLHYFDFYFETETAMKLVSHTNLPIISDYNKHLKQNSINFISIHSCWDELASRISKSTSTIQLYHLICEIFKTMWRSYFIKWKLSMVLESFHHLFV